MTAISNDSDVIPCETLDSLHTRELELIKNPEGKLIALQLPPPFPVFQPTFVISSPWFYC